MKVIAFAASSSRRSINRRLAAHAASLLPEAEVELLDLNDYEMPLFSEDRERELGQPEAAKAFLAKIGEADGLIVGLAEHNGTFSAAWKSLFDWCTRIEQKVFQGKPMVLLAASPGPGGAGRVLAAAEETFPFFGGEVKATLSVPKFQEAFDEEAGGLVDDDLRRKLAEAVSRLTA